MIYSLLYKIFEKVRTKALKAKLKAGDTNILGEVNIWSKDIQCGKNVTIYPYVTLWGKTIEIGDDTKIGNNTIINAINKIHIGANTAIAAQCYIIDANHGIQAGTPIREQAMDVSSDGIFIGDDVWIGAQCVIVKGAYIGNGAVIGANSLVNSHIPDNAIAFGSPARVHGYRK